MPVADKFVISKPPAAEGTIIAPIPVIADIWTMLDSYSPYMRTFKMGLHLTALAGVCAWFLSVLHMAHMESKERSRRTAAGIYKQDFGLFLAHIVERG